CLPGAHLPGDPCEPAAGASREGRGLPGRAPARQSQRGGPGVSSHGQDRADDTGDCDRVRAVLGAFLPRAAVGGVGPAGARGRGPLCAADVAGQPEQLHQPLDLRL
ncbi:unnamed protein product, partial [Gulo gulo]